MEEQHSEDKEDLAHGSLSLLSHLQLRARAAAQAGERRERLRERREWLRGRVGELRESRHWSRDRLALLEQLGTSGIPWVPSAREVLQWKIRECRERLRLLQLTGLCVRRCPAGLCFSFHSSFQGSSCPERFHLELQEFLTSPEFPEFRLRRHSIPPFIPLERLSREFLPGKPREFLGILFQHLNAFAGRRQQLRQLQAEFAPWLSGEPVPNSLGTLVTFGYRIPRGKAPNIPGKHEENPEFPEFPEFRARLLYEDPLSSRPTHVSITTEGGSPVPAAHSELFHGRSLAGALRALQRRERPESWECSPGTH